MINPETLDIKALPWLPLEEKSAFPKKPAIYFAIDSQGTVQYIGRSVNVHQRWGNHHKYGVLSKIERIKIAYLFVDTVELLPKIETALIEWFDPLLNNSFSKRKKPNYAQVSGYVQKDKALKFKINCTALQITQSEALDEAISLWLEKNKSSKDVA